MFTIRNQAEWVNCFVVVEWNNVKTMMYYPKNAEVVIGADEFFINGVKFTPYLGEARNGLGKVVRIRKEDPIGLYCRR